MSKEWPSVTAVCMVQLHLARAPLAESDKQFSIYCVSSCGPLLMSVVVSNLAGGILAEISPVPEDLLELRLKIEEITGIPGALQKLVKDGELLTSLDLPAEGFEVLCVKDETPMCSWDSDGNPDSEQIEVDGAVVCSPNLRTDFVNVLTKEPMRSGMHYYEFVLHKVGDEQWCGVTMSPEMAGQRYGGRELEAWTYYCGRAGRSGGSIHNGKGALHACTKAVAEFEKACTPGNVIGMLVDVDKRVLAFALDGRVQGACKLPGDKPLYVLTHVDTPADHVELRKPSLEEAPPENLEALSGALLDAEKGETLHW
ncbi:UVR8 [Symbiodinium natans]|uniref:UVR8 protein n=1 Tax=Symbiodinium natans TaxID=878477 RepID=A0A812M549_9DINO|nr:UVR8 [Symbiodinium natans]